jgi:Tfp pilus assembly protein PilN
MIQINLHDYRYELRKIAIQKRVVICITIIIAAFVLIVLSWLLEQSRLGLMKNETSKIEFQVEALKSGVQRVKEMEANQNRMETIIAGIEVLREQQLPADTIVSHLNIAIPEGLWLTSIIQKGSNELRLKNIPFIMFDDPAKKKKKGNKRKESIKQAKEFIEVSGYALTEEEVVEYMKRLQQLSYYKTTFLYKSAQLVLGGQSIYQFVIYCYMPVKKKAA